MKTVFRVGMTVYDSFNFPGEKGIIKSIKEDEYISSYPITVLFKRNNGNRDVESYTIEGSYKKGNIPTLSTKPYRVELHDFEQESTAPTFEEVLVNCDKRYPPNIRADVDYKEIYPTKELSYAAEALRKLLFLRDYYNEGWQPNWKDDNIRKYNILTELGKVEKGNSFSANRILSFRTEEIRNKFLEEQIDLLEIAKPLL